MVRVEVEGKMDGNVILSHVKDFSLEIDSSLNSYSLRAYI